ncbi:MAG: Gfo/Idh/MocA family oxidoreductase [Polyangia bacterium]
MKQDSQSRSPGAPRPLCVAIVGCGKIADGHVEEIRKLPGQAQVVAVCDREGLMAEQLATRFAIPAHYDDFAQLLERERPDVVHITTPPQSHAALALQALAAGCHVYVEKPFALDGAQAAQMVAAAQSQQRKITVGHSYFFDPPALQLRRLVAEGALGEPVHVESFYGYDLGGAFGKALLADTSHWVHGLPGKLFHNIIDHMLNKILEFVPDEVPQVTALASSLRPERFGDERDAMMDELRVLVWGQRVTGYGTFSSHIRPAGHLVRVYGTRNTAHVDLVARTVTLQASPKLPSAIGRLLPPFEQAGALVGQGWSNLGRFLHSDFQYFAGMRHLMSLFFDSIAHDGPLPISYRDILRITNMMDEIFRQVRAQGAAAEGSA